MTTPSTLLEPDPISPWRKLEIGVFLAALVLGSMFLRGWIDERAARDQAEAFAKQADAQIATLTQQLAASKVQEVAYQAKMSEAADKVTTAAQAVKVITQYLPAAPTAAGAPASAPEAIPVIEANELDKAALAELPSSPSYAILTPEQTVAIAKNDLECDADRHSLSSCTLQLADAQRISALEKAEAGKYKAALAGGTLLQRVGRVLKSAACGGAGAAAGIAFAHGSPAQISSSALGAAGGVVACSLF